MSTRTVRGVSRSTDRIDERIFTRPRATVPLWFVAEANWRGPIVVLGLNSLGRTRLLTFGEIIAEAPSPPRQTRRPDRQRRYESSTHVDGPFGFDSRGPAFDQWFLEKVRRGGYRQLLQCDPELETEAAQDALDSALVALAATGFSATGRKFSAMKGHLASATP
jgi:aromatic ring-opening dioxygenase LigB subunit